MRFSQDFLDEIRERVPISDLVGRRVKLRRQGREWVGLSPFNKEKTPSFYVNDQKRFYHCFSSGQHGDIFKFLMDTEGLAFPEAVEKLASDAGLAMPVVDVQEAKREQEKRSLFDVMEAAARYFDNSLRNPVHGDALRYARSRQLSDDTLQEFRFGFSPNRRDGLKSALMSMGIEESALLETGLIIKPEDGRATYDRFRNRLMIPIHDDRGRIVAFGGRSLDPEGKPKYLNSPETKLFHKGNILFNAHRSRQAAYETGEMIVVEGYMDAIALFQAGFQHVVATLGTAFTEIQITRLWRLCQEPILCFDGDRAGKQASYRALERILPLLKAGYSFNIVRLAEGEDPDDLIVRGGAPAMRKELDRAIPLSDLLWQKETELLEVNTPERKAALEARFDELFKGMTDQRVANRYKVSFRSRLNELFWSSERNGRKKSKGAAVPSVAIAPPPGSSTAIEHIILGLGVHYPQLMDAQIDRLSRLRLSSSALDALKDEICRAITGQTDLDERTDITTEIGSGHLELLKQIYGNSIGDDLSIRGNRLRHNFKIIADNPPATYVQACIRNFIDMLELREIEVHLKTELDASMIAFSDEIAERVMYLTNEANRRREEVARHDQDLAEEAKVIRKSRLNPKKATADRL
ncbi:MAG: DNA primase [Cohaesibacteraceae bacterium]|nr:DNA primase [Cohaesibacteraceae bacterium]